MKIISIGRSRNNDIVIDDATVTRVNHCQFIQDDHGKFKVIDYSKNGTFVNGIRIGKGREVPLCSTDIVRVGNSTLPWQNYFKTSQMPAPPTIQGWIRFGRASDNDVIVNDGRVSRYHMRIVQYDGQFEIEDLGSTNGTFVNGMRITGRKSLHMGDTVKIGNSPVNWSSYFEISGDNGTQIDIAPEPPYDDPVITPKTASTQALQAIALLASLGGLGCLICCEVKIIKWGIFAFIGNTSTLGVIAGCMSILSIVLAFIAEAKEETDDTQMASIAKTISGLCISVIIGFIIYINVDPNALNPFRNLIK